MELGSVHNDERGIVWIVSLLLSMAFATLFGAMFFDVGRAYWVKEQAQTAVDAAALAGAMTGQLVGTSTDVPTYDSNGNLIKIDQQTTWSVQIDQAQADQQAQLLYNINMGQYADGKKFVYCPSSDVSGQTPSNDEYSSGLARGQIETILLGPVARLYGYDMDNISVGAKGTAKAVPTQVTTGG